MKKTRSRVEWMWVIENKWVSPELHTPSAEGKSILIYVTMNVHWHEVTDRSECPSRPSGGVEPECTASVNYMYAGSAGKNGGRNVAAHQEKHSPTAQHENNNLLMQNNWVSVYKGANWVSCKGELCENVLWQRVKK